MRLSNVRSAAAVSTLFMVGVAALVAWFSQPDGTPPGSRGEVAAADSHDEKGDAEGSALFGELRAARRATIVAEGTRRMANQGIFEAGDVTLESGVVLPATRVVYRTHGRLNAARDNAIVYPTHYIGTHDSNAWVIGPGMALDPDKYFIIIPNMLGNGLSSSPSNTPAPFDGPRFPLVTVRDNVLLQHRLVTELFGITTLALVTGYSMGALQSFQWGAQFPDMVQRIAPFCGAARVSRHNWLFLEGCKSALLADAAFAGGDYGAPPVTGIRAFARVYAGWAWSQTFFRQQLDREALGLPSLEAFLTTAWEPAFQAHDANNLLAMLATWQAADISADPRFGDDIEKALAAITAKAIVMPCRTDLYFPPEDSEIEVAHMPNAELRIIPSVWGHMAGGGVNPDDKAFINAALVDLLAR